MTGHEPRTLARPGPSVRLDRAAKLLHYLETRLGIPNLRYRAAPTAVRAGDEAYSYQFQLQAANDLPAAFTRPLILRWFAGTRGVARGRRTFAAQRHLHELDYPVPVPVCWEENDGILGSPFLITEQIPGPTLLQRMMYRPWSLYGAAARLADMQTRLHSLPADNFPCPARPLLPRSLAEIHDQIDRCDRPWLAPALDWLSAHQPAPPPSPCILHLHFHPLNVIQRNDQSLAVLDWDAADVGDPHADVAMTLVLLRCAPHAGSNWWERLGIRLGRCLVSACYLFACRMRMELDEAKLAYYEAWAILCRLCRYGRCLTAGPHVTGALPALAPRLRREHVETLCRYFARLTGITLQPEGALWEPRSTVTLF